MFTHIPSSMLWRMMSSGNNDVNQISVEDMDAIRMNKSSSDSKYMIFDVREESELSNDFHLKGNDWLLIPQGKFFQLKDVQELENMLSSDFFIDLKTYDQLYFLCKVGRRSNNVAKHFLDMDVTQDLFNIAGGIVSYDENIGLK